MCPGYMVLRMTIDAVTRRSERQTRLGMEAKSGFEASTLMLSAEHGGDKSPRRAIKCSFMAAVNVQRISPTEKRARYQGI